MLNVPFWWCAAETLMWARVGIDEEPSVHLKLSDHPAECGCSVSTAPNCIF